MLPPEPATCPLQPTLPIEATGEIEQAAWLLQQSVRKLYLLESLFRSFQNLFTIDKGTKVIDELETYRRQRALCIAYVLEVHPLG